MDIIGHPASVLILALVGGGFAFAATMIAMVMVDQINEKLPEERRLPPLGWGIGITRQHRKFYPDSKLAIPFYLCVSCSYVCFIAAFWIWAAARHAGR